MATMDIDNNPTLLGGGNKGKGKQKLTGDKDNLPW